MKQEYLCTSLRRQTNSKPVTAIQALLVTEEYTQLHLLIDILSSQLKVQAPKATKIRYF